MEKQTEELNVILNKTAGQFGIIQYQSGIFCSVVDVCSNERNGSELSWHVRKANGSFGYDAWRWYL